MFQFKVKNYEQMAYVQYIVPDTHGKSAAEIQNELKVKDVINEKTPLIKDC